MFKLSLSVWGTFYESVLYTFLGVFLLKNIFEKDGKTIYYILFGFLSGFVLWLSYVNLVAVITWLVLWLGIERDSLFDGKIFLTAGFFLIGIIPVIIDNILFGLKGLYIYDVPIYRYFFGQNFSETAEGIVHFFINGFAGSFLFQKAGFWGWTLNYFYFSLVIISGIFVAVRFLPRLKSFIQNIFRLNRENKADLSLFLIIYPVLYLFFYFVTSFESQYIHHFKNNRYLFPLYPFVMIWISVFLVDLFKNKILKTTCVVLAVVLLSSGLYTYGTPFQLIQRIQLQKFCSVLGELQRSGRLRETAHR